VADAPLEPDGDGAARPGAAGPPAGGDEGARPGAAGAPMGGGGPGEGPSALRLLGLDRSGPPPPQTLAGQPLRPWTVPNAIGFVRLALIPVFLVLALAGSSSGGVDAGVAALFAAIAAGDYADGAAARLTGQYSRLGALMDPLTDRLLVVSGVAVCWHFALLSRWALAVLLAREVAMVALGRYGLARGVELRINWPGRVSVAPLMGALFLAMAGAEGVAAVLLYCGLVLALLASALYVRDGLAHVRGSGPAKGLSR
jgi:phosphatidylglycerophosphate synthase